MRTAKQKKPAQSGNWVSMPYDDYRNHVAVAYSDLKRVNKSPWHFANPTRGAATPAQVMGTLIHSYGLEGAAEFIVAPATYTTEKGEMKAWNWNAKACKEWGEANCDKTIVSQSEYAMLQSARDTLISDPWARPLITGNGVTEGCLFATHKGMAIKGRIDRYDSDTKTLVDLKTCTDASRGEFQSDFRRYQYNRQMAFYKLLCELNGIEVNRVVIVALEKGLPCQVGCYEVGSEALRVGLAAVEQMMDRVMACSLKNEWPGYSGADRASYQELTVSQWESEAYPIEVPISFKTK